MNEEDLRFDIFRAGDYEVRITHLPTGHVATCTNASLMVARAEALAELDRKTDASAAIQAAIDAASAAPKHGSDSGRRTIATVRLPPTIHVVDGRPKE